MLDLVVPVFPKLQPSPPKESAGWISPQGELYPCESYEHTTMAQDLVDQYYQARLKHYDACRRLEDAGWVHLRESGHWWDSSLPSPTQAQLDMLHDLAMFGDYFGGNVMQHLQDCILMEAHQ